MGARVGVSLAWFHAADSRYRHYVPRVSPDARGPSPTSL